MALFYPYSQATVFACLLLILGAVVLSAIACNVLFSSIVTDNILSFTSTMVPIIKYCDYQLLYDLKKHFTGLYHTLFRLLYLHYFYSDGELVSIL